MEDFKFKHSDWWDGLMAALMTAVVLLIVPVVLIIVEQGQVSGPASGALKNEMSALMTLVILVSIPAIAASFLRGMFPKGTHSRLTFGMVEVAVVLLYAYIVLLGSNLSTVLGLMKYQPDLNRVFLTLLYLIALIAVGHLSTWFWHRREWLESIGTKLPEKKPLPKGLGLEFSPRMGVPPLAQKEARSTLLSLVIAPALIFLLMIPAVPLLMNSTLPADLQSFLNRLDQIPSIILGLGVILFPIAWMRGFYAKGSFGRLTFGLAFTVFLVIYIFFVLTVPDIGTGLHDLGVHLDFALLVTMLMIVPLFYAIETFGEFWDERKPWKARLGFEIKGKPLNVASPFLDFNYRMGKIGDGAETSRKAYIGWMLVPIILLSLLAGVLDDTTSITNNLALANEMTRIAAAIAPIGLLIVIISFFFGYYPRGCFGRLVLGMAIAAVILLYVMAIFMNGELETAFRNSGLKIGLEPILSLFLFYAAISFIVPICELVDNRRKWKFKVGRPMKPLSPPAKGLFSDFKLRYARFVAGTKGARSALKKYVIVPVLIVTVIRAALMSIDLPSLPIVDLAAMRDAINSLLDLNTSIFIVGGAMVVVQFWRNSWGRGSFSRLVFGLGATGVGVLWTIVLLSGLMSMNTNVQIGIPGTGFALDISGQLNQALQYIFIIAIVLSCLAGVKYFREYLHNRRFWLEDRDKGVV